MRCLIAIGLLLATATAGAQGHLVQRWLTDSQMLPPWQSISSQDDALPSASAMNIDCCKTTTLQRAVYIVETKQVMVAPGGHATTTTPAPGGTTNVLPPQPFVGHPPGYTYVPETGSMYKFHENGAPWDDAEATCVREGGHLVVINDAVEADAVVNILAKAGYKYTWIGLRDRRPEGKIDWRAISGEPLSTVYNRWDNGRPYTTGDWTCGYLYDDKILYDSPCHVPNYFTCEISQL